MPDLQGLRPILDQFQRMTSHPDDHSKFPKLTAQPGCLAERITSYSGIWAPYAPESCFVGLPDYSFLPKFRADLSGYEGPRVHYLDEGPRDARVTFACLHSQPAWSYLRGKQIPVLVESGLRVIAPDLLGFGAADAVLDAAGAHRSQIATLRYSTSSRCDLPSAGS